MSVEPKRARPRAFADPWDAPGTPRPPTTIANPLGAAGRPTAPTLEPTSIGPRFRRLEIDELAAVPRVDDAGGLDLSPDGLEATFAWDRSGALEIYTAPLVGDRIIQLTDAGARSWAPRWSPDGHWIAFVRERGGRGSLWVVDRDGAHEREIGPGDALHAGVTLSDRGPRWSEDTASAALAAERVEHAAGSACWSSDRSTIAFTAPGDPAKIAFAHVRDGRVVRSEVLRGTPFADSDPIWRPDGRAVVYRRRERGNVTLRRVFTVSRADDAVMDLPGAFAGHRVAPDNETVVAVFTSPRTGSDVVARTRGAVEIARLTRSLPGTIDPAVLVDPVYVTETERRAPALVHVPHAEAGLAGAAVVRVERVERGWDALAQLLANRGETVVVTSAPRGAELEQARAILAEARLDVSSRVRTLEPIDVYAQRSARADALSRAAGEPHNT